MDWILCGFDDGNSSGAKKNQANLIVLLKKGSGGIEACASSLYDDGRILFGGSKITKTGRFVSFVYIDLNRTPAMARGRASMFKNGVLNTFVGCDCEIEMIENITESETLLQISKATGSSFGTNSNAKVKGIVAGTRATSLTPKKKEISSTEKPTDKNDKAHTQDPANKGFDESKKYSVLSYDYLKNNDDLPAGIDLKCKEMLLSDEEFFSVFKINKNDFQSLPQWKRMQKKKAVGLF